MLGGSMDDILAGEAVIRWRADLSEARAGNDQAKKDFQRACEECPHWDYENDPSAGQECCMRYYDAEYYLHVAERVVAREKKNETPPF